MNPLQAEAEHGIRIQQNMSLEGRDETLCSFHTGRSSNKGGSLYRITSFS